MITNKNLQRIFSAALFLITGGVLFSTMAPSVSLWDCGEFITCIAKLEVGHPPGAPFYLLLARLFTLFAGDPSRIAFWSNMLSVVASAATVVLLFAILVNMFRKLFPENTETPVKFLNILIPAFIGAMAFGFTDTFWFSAVESEVYALSIFFTALVIWAIFKWEESFARKEKGSVRWLIFISYLMGLSTGVHLLNLLTIPVILQIVWFRFHDFTWKRFFISLGYGLLILGIILFGFIQNGLWLAKKLELILVNGFGAPFNSGLVLFAALLFGGLFYGIFKTYNKKRKLHFLLLNILVYFIGYSSYALIIIRANAETPINLNNPSNVFALESFLNREQYGDKPLLYGPYYGAQSTGITYKTDYRPAGDKYEAFEKADKYLYNDKDKMLFPRMFSPQMRHIYGYRQWAGVKIKSPAPPTFGQNMKFLFDYQLGFMYFRYFMWNFSGRQNDEQGDGGPLRGNWITGIKSIDAARLGKRDTLNYMEAASKAHNRYYLLPFLFGIIGIVFLSMLGKKGNHYLREILLLLLITGPGIVFYLNQTPFEPRERDYAYVGSFFAYAVFIGFGVYGFMHYMRIKLKNRIGTILAVVVSFLALPVILLVNNYDDHDRSNRYLARNMAKSYLNSCENGSVLFTYGDNDTYPLWYAQEVENVRPDLRVINYGLMGADWCVMQLYNKINDAPPLDLTIKKERYKEGNLDNALLLDKSKEFVDLKKVVRFIGSDKKETKLPLRNGRFIDYSPTRNFLIVNNDSSATRWTNPKEVLYKNDIVMLDLLSNGLTKRPVYLTVGSSPDVYSGLNRHLELLMPVFKLTPDSSAGNRNGFIKPERMYDIYMNRMNLGEQDKAYYDYFSRSTFDIMRYRASLNRLISALLKEDKQKEAVEIIKRSLKEYPVETAPYHDGNVGFVKLMWKAGMKDEAEKLFGFLTDVHIHNLIFYGSQDEEFLSLVSYDVQQEMSYEKKLKRALLECKQDTLLKHIYDFYNK
ncbi:MAG: DUF2723 domain-containing protein [Chlorobi bacterium]|nr:DUF2723 domain-containing protein [Chlorobiota bacterium]